MADQPSTETALRDHLEADPPSGHGMPNPVADAMSMSAMTTRHDEMHAAMHGAGDHSHTDMARSEDIVVRSMAARELDVRIMPWGQVSQGSKGTEEFARGAFDHIDPKSVYLWGLEHELHMGIGYDGQPQPTRHPVGKGIASSNEPDGQHMTFRVAKTARGDEVLALAEEGLVTGVSPEFRPASTQMRHETRQGRRHSVVTKADLTGVSTTYRPAYGDQAAVLAVRSQLEGEAPMGEQTLPEVGAPAPVVPAITEDRLTSVLESFAGRSQGVNEAFMDRLTKLEEAARSEFVVPGVSTDPANEFTRGRWMEYVLKSLSGERIPATEARAAEDIITSDNIGVVPPTYSSELIGVIDASRPFMSTTRRLPVPATGMSLIVPVITQRPIVAEQTTEKTALASQTTKIGTKTFDMITKGGYGDISLQLLKRADRSFLDLYLQLLAEAYAIESEAEAVDALLHATEPLNPDPLNPNSLSLGAAFVTSFDAIRRAPDTIWLSTAAVGEFIDAKATTTNQPLYPGLSPSATAGGGIRGNISGLNAVHVPALDVHGAYAIVGPSSGFAWAEDGTYTLQVDVPAKAGRDVALVGMLWFAPWYPAAFTVYNVAS